MPSPSLAAEVQADIARLAAEGLSKSEVARTLRVNWSTAAKYWPDGRATGEPLSEPMVTVRDRPIGAFPVPRITSRADSARLPPAVSDPTSVLPASVAPEYPPYQIDTSGRWLVIGDLHLPYHDCQTIELAVAEARRRGVVGVILNGDVLDSHEVSNHDRDPTAPRYVHEVEVAQQFLAWLRDRLPQSRIVMKEGNHEDRLTRYIIQRAPALFGLEGLDLQSLLHCKDYGVEWVGDKRVIWAGKLAVIHGHEYRGGGGVNPARWLFLRARYVSMCNHFHRTSEHHEPNIRGKAEAAWSVGCACHLSPRYMPLNTWNHGFAFLDLDQSGDFSVENKRVLNGKVV